MKDFAIDGETQTSVIQKDEMTFTLCRSDVCSPASSASGLASAEVAVDDTYTFPDGVGYE